MKITNWHKKFMATLVAGGLLASTALHAEMIPLGDAGFEDYALPGGGGTSGFAYQNGYRPTSPWVDDPDSPPGYTEDGGRSNWMYDAAYASTTGTQASPAGPGDQAMHGRASYNGQELTEVFEAGKTYTFSLYSQGDSNTFGDESRVWLYIYNGSIPFFQDTALIAEKFNRFDGDFVNRDPLWSDAESQAAWQQISVSHSVFPGSAEVGQPIGVAFWAGYDAAVDNASLEVINTPIPPVLTLIVNTTTGETQIHNTTGGTVNIDYYEITSAMDALDPNDGTGWNSLEDQDLTGFPAGTGVGDGWEEAGGSDEGALSESFLTGNSPIADASNVSLGAAFQIGGQHDLVFKYGVLPQLEADFDGDNDVNGDDFLAWQRGAGMTSGATKADGDANGDQAVDSEDLALWEADYGTEGITGTGVLTAGDVVYVTSFADATAAVPEPSSVLIVGVGLLGLLAGGRHSQRNRT